MKAKILIFVIVAFLVTIINGQNITKTKEIVFKFNNYLDNVFGGMELVNNDLFLVKGRGATEGGINNNFVSLVNFNGVVWEKNVFSATTSGEGFSGDAIVDHTNTAIRFYATTPWGVKVYDEVGSVIDSNLVLYGTKSKFLQKVDSTILVTKIVDGNLFLYKVVQNKIEDSVLIRTNVLDILSRSFDYVSKSWFLTMRLNGNSTALVKINSDTVIWSKVYESTNRCYVSADDERIFLAISYLGNDFKYRTKVLSINHSGDMIWEYYYIPAETIDSSSIVKNISLFEGGCTIVGISGQDLNTTYKGTFVVNINDSGLLWEKVFQDDYRSPVTVMWNEKKELLIGGLCLSSCYISSYFVEGVTAVEEENRVSPLDFLLEQNYPNPFNPSTSIRFELPTSTNVQLIVYNQLGEQVAELVNGYVATGTHEVAFNGDGLSSGVYFARLTVGANVQNKKMLLIK